MKVLACSIIATFIAIYYVATFGDEDKVIDFESAPLRSYLLASYIGHYACCASDTWASELGVLSKGSPWLITTGRRVPAGTNGGVSVLGTVAAVAGGACMGLLYYLVSFASGSQQVHVITLGAVMGLFGCVLDSVLGATVQASYFNTKTHKICDEADHMSGKNGNDTKHICGVSLLTNEQVNAVSVLATTLLSGYIAEWLLF